MDGCNLSCLLHKLTAEVHGRSGSRLLSHWADTQYRDGDPWATAELHRLVSLPSNEHNAGSDPLPVQKQSKQCPIHARAKLPLNTSPEVFMGLNTGRYIFIQSIFYLWPKDDRRMKQYLPWHYITFIQQTLFSRAAFNAGALAGSLSSLTSPPESQCQTWLTTFPYQQAYAWHH